MSQWCVQSGRHRLRKLAGAAMCALLAAAIFGCGRTAPEEFWEPTKDDTAGIKAAIEASKGYFRTGLAELAMLYCDTALPGTTATILKDELTGNPYKRRFRLDSLQHVLDTTAYGLKYTFIATLDTVIDSFQRDTVWVESTHTEAVATVTMAETIPGKVLMHAWERTDSVAVDTIVKSPTETLFLTRYSTTMAPCSTVIEKPFTGASIEGCVLRKGVDGVWQLWKMAGGGRFYAPGPDDAPYIDHFYLKSANNRVDTVFLRPDTLHYGMQRFYSRDNQLLTYNVGDWLVVSNVTTNQIQAYDYVYFNGRRYGFRYPTVLGESDTVRFVAEDTGIHRLSTEHIPATVLWEVDGDYNATTWGIPIRIQ